MRYFKEIHKERRKRTKYSRKNFLKLHRKHMFFGLNQFPFRLRDIFLKITWTLSLLSFWWPYQIDYLFNWRKQSDICQRCSFQQRERLLYFALTVFWFEVRFLNTYQRIREEATRVKVWFWTSFSHLFKMWREGEEYEEDVSNLEDVMCFWQSIFGSYDVPNWRI